MSRREAVRWLGLGAAGIAVAACAPVQIALHHWPERFDADEELTDRVLRAFVDTVVPGAAGVDPARVYADPFYGLAPYRSFLAVDLCRRAERLHGDGRFDRLPSEARTAVVRDGLHADGTTRRLYTGAAFVAQLSTYAGVYDDERGCPLIEFEGRYRPRPLDQVTYPSPGRFLAAGVTTDGNYA